MGDRILWNEADAQAGRHHGLDPVLPFTAVNFACFESPRIASLPQDVAILAIYAQQVILAGDLVDLDRILLGKAVAERKRNNEPLLVEAASVETRIEWSRLRHDRDIE